MSLISPLMLVPQLMSWPIEKLGTAVSFQNMEPVKLVHRVFSCKSRCSTNHCQLPPVAHTFA